MYNGMNNQTIQQIKPKRKITIALKQEILKNHLEAINIIYQPNEGFFIATKKQNISMNGLNALCNELDLKVCIFGLHPSGNLKLFLENRK